MSKTYRLAEYLRIGLEAPSDKRCLGKRLTYHRKGALRRVGANGYDHDLRKIRLFANSAVRTHAAKPRNVRRNSHPSNDKNTLHIRDLIRGRRERDSNHESASPYPFEMSIDFSKVGTTDIQYLACTLWLRDASSKVVFSEVSRVLGR